LNVILPVLGLCRPVPLLVLFPLLHGFVILAMDLVDVDVRSGPYRGMSKPLRNYC